MSNDKYDFIDADDNADDEDEMEESTSYPATPSDLKYFKAISADELAPALEQCGVKHPDLSNGRHQQMVQCLHPDHPDKNPSLRVEWHVSALQSMIKLTCWPCQSAGRKFWKIYRDIGIEPSKKVDAYDYFSTTGSRLGRKQVPRYYDQESGEQVDKAAAYWTYPMWNAHGVVYYVSKKHWLEKTPNRELPVPLLYKLPEISQGSGTIYLPEGEKDVETLVSKGYLASCEPNGAGSWKPGYAELLKPYTEIVILLDNDSAGIRRKSLIARQFIAQGKTVKAIQFNGDKKCDVTDWFNAGHTPQEFDDLVKNAHPLQEEDLDLDCEISGQVLIPKGVRKVLIQLSKDYIYLTEHHRNHLTQIVQSEISGFSVSHTTPLALKSAFYAGYKVYLKFDKVNKKTKDVETLVEPINVVDYWNQPQNYDHSYGPKIYTRIDFDPRPKPERGIYNLWTGIALKPTYDQDVTEWLDFLRVIICGEDTEAYEFFLDFFAQLFQYPHRIPMVSLVLRGERRSGKSGIIDFFRRMLAQYAYVAQHWENVIGRFNSHLASKLLVVIDDASWGGYKQGVGFLNNLITGLTIAIEAKGQDAVNLRNFSRVVIIGNSKWLVPKTRDDGRFFVMDIPPRTRRDAFYQGFFEKWQQPENLSKLLGYLRRREISQWHPIDIVRNRMVGHDMSGHEFTLIERFAIQCAESQSLYYPSKCTPTAQETKTSFQDLWKAAWPTKIEIKTVRNSYRAWCDEFRHHDDSDEIRFSGQWYEVLGVNRKDPLQVKRSNSITWWHPQPVTVVQKALKEKYKLGDDYFREDDEIHLIRQLEEGL